MKALPCCTCSCRDSTRPTTTPVAEPSSSSVTALTPSQALQAHSHALTGYEQSEILNQQDIYFLGLGANKIEGQPHSSDLNHGHVTTSFPAMPACLSCLHARPSLPPRASPASPFSHDAANSTALLRILGQGTSQATGFCHAVAEHLALSCLIDEGVPEHVKVHHSPCVQAML